MKFHGTLSLSQLHPPHYAAAPDAAEGAGGATEQCGYGGAYGLQQWMTVSECG